MELLQEMLTKLETLAPELVQEVAAREMAMFWGEIALLATVLVVGLAVATMVSRVFAKSAEEEDREFWWVPFAVFLVAAAFLTAIMGTDAVRHYAKAKSPTVTLLKDSLRR